MSNPVAYYKQFIDALAAPELSSPVTSRHIREWGTDIPKGYVTDEAFNRLMEQFTSEQRQEIANLVQSGYEEGMFNVLRHISDEIYFDKMRIVVQGVEVPVEPFGMTFYEDWIGRKSGEYLWPDERAPE